MDKMQTSGTSCPEERRIHNRRRKHNEWRTRPEYIEKSAIFLAKNQWCEIWLEVGIKKRATEIHHPNPWSYASFEIYVDFDNNGAMAVTGSRNGGGHYACHHDLKVCPICKKNKCNRFAEACRSCLEKKYPELKGKLERAKEQQREDRNARKRLKTKKRQYQRHPCARRGLNQKCRRRTGEICTYSDKKAENCPTFKAKIAKAEAA